MNTITTLYLSNQLEILACFLKNNLLSLPSPWTKKYVVVPSCAMKEWLSFTMARDPSLNVCTAITFIYLEEALAHFASLFFHPQEKKRAEDLEHLLHIEKECKRSLAYCKNLAFLFKRESLYTAGGLDTDLYKKVFSYYTPEYDFFKKLEKKQEDCLQNCLQDYALHVFGFNHIAPVHLEFLLRLPCHFYNFSPCQEFWTDALSDKEIKIFFQKKKLSKELRREWENYLEERHPLLANLGKVGRQLAILFEESEVTTIEEYEDKEPISLLNIVQGDLLHVRKSPISQVDNSIQVHLFSTRHKEIETLFYNLQALMGQKNIMPGDVRIFAPDIQLYAPFIRSYFGQELPCRIVDDENGPSDPLNAFQLLFDLENRRWSPEAILELLFHPLFKRAFRYEEKQLLKNWIEKEPIHFGYNLEHANILLRKSHCTQGILDETKTWEAAFRRQFLAYATDQFSSHFSIVEAPLLGECAKLLHTLYTDLKAIHEENKESCLEEWVDHFIQIFTSYFCSSEIERALEDFKKKSGPFIHSIYSFQRICALVMDFLLKQKSFAYNEYQAITFSTLMPGRVVPAKIIVLLGMNEGQFPRKEENYGQKKGNYPLREDLDRYLFLESLLLAKEHLILSYQGLCPLDGSEQLPSSCLSELLFYLPKGIITKHPNLNFEKIDAPPPTFSSSIICAPICPANLEKELFIPISELRTLLRNPLKFFFYKKFGLYVERPFTEEEFALSWLDRFHVRQQFFHKPLAEIVHTLQVQGKMPLAFKDLFLKRLNQENQRYHIFLKEHRIEPALIQKRDISHTVVHGGQKIHFKGKMEGITPEGVILFDKYAPHALVGHLGDFLLVNAVENQSKLLFALENKVQELKLTAPDKLFSHLVNYYMLAQKRPIPLLPDWLEPLMAGEEKKLEQKIKTSFTEAHPALLMAFPKVPQPSYLASCLIEEWQAFATDLFKDLYA